MALKRILLLLIVFFVCFQVKTQIICNTGCSGIEQYAAKQLQGYIYQLWGTWLKLYPDIESCPQPVFIMGLSGQKAIEDLQRQKDIDISTTNPGSQGYLLKTISHNDKKCLVIASNDPSGLLYGVYGLMSDYFNISFSFSGDLLPDPAISQELPVVNEINTPSERIRGFLPWTNFPQSATVYSWKDWKFIIDQAAKMRFNFILVHNYNGELGHNEMFHNFTLNGITSRVWMPTVRTGHGWGGPSWDVHKYLFEAADFFDDYDFGSECALHNEFLSNEEVAAKGVSLFQQVIRYAHSRGIKMGLGIDIDLIPAEYKVASDNPAVIKARVHQLATDYPDLDYLFCFQSENVGKNPAFHEKWKRIFDGFYKGMKEKSPNTKIAASGWGLNPASVSQLPKDVICAPISYYTAAFENGAAYGDREYWGCPWLERDIASSQYYYPYNIDLSTTIESYREKAPNMKGLFCLTWRLTDAIGPKLDYISKAPWDSNKKLSSSKSVYKTYAIFHYGAKAADAITEIINQNEAFASDFGECQKTPAFENTDRTASLMNLSYFALATGKNLNNYHKIMAKHFNEEHGTKISKSGEEGDSCIAGINAGDWLKYNNISFSGSPTQIDISISSANPNGGVLKCKLDSLHGKTIGTINVNSTSSWKVWVKKKMIISQVEGTHMLYFVFEPLRNSAMEHAKAVRQLKVIDHWIALTPSKTKRAQLLLLRQRIAAVKDHLELNDVFSNYSWKDLPGKVAEWCGDFLNRVVDISSLGNINSQQNRFIQLNYVAKIKALSADQQLKAPANLVAKGTSDGAVLTWIKEDSSADNFLVYRNEIKIGQVSGSINHFRDRYSGVSTYSVIAQKGLAIKSAPAIPYTCFSGSSDTTAPRITMISPPVSQPIGQGLSFKVSLLDNHICDDLSVKLFYRKPGERHWGNQKFQHKVNTTFTIDLPGALFDERGLEYYIEANDGQNISRYPVNAPHMNLLVVTYLDERHDTHFDAQRILLSVSDKTIHWQNIQNKDAFQYRVYRSAKPDFKPGLNTFVTYLSHKSNIYRDFPQNFDGSKLKGSWYYRLTSVDIDGNESSGSNIVKVQYEN